MSNPIEDWKAADYSWLEARVATAAMLGVYNLVKWDGVIAKYSNDHIYISVLYSGTPHETRTLDQLQEHRWVSTEVKNG